MSGRHMNVRPKRLTRKQKEALSAHGWDSRVSHADGHAVFKVRC